MSTLGHPNVMASFFADEQPDPSAQAISQRWWTSAFCAGDPATAQRRSLEPLRTRWIPIDWNIGKVDIWGDWAERSTTGETSFLFFLGYIYICIYIHIREIVLNIYQDEPGLVFPYVIAPCRKNCLSKSGFCLSPTGNIWGFPKSGWPQIIQVITESPLT